MGYDHSDPLAAYPRRLCRGGTTPRRLFGLAPAGVYRAARVTTCAVSSYLTLSPLPDPACGWPSAVSFLWHFPSSHDAQTLSGGSSYGARTFLDTCGCHSCRDRPAAHYGSINRRLRLSNWWLCATISVRARLCSPNRSLLGVVEPAIGSPLTC